MDNYFQVENICHSYKESSFTLGELSFSLGKGDFLSLVGPSGCGKTTLLKILSGFIKPTSGSVLVDGKEITNLVPERRCFGMVFQNYGLFPHLNVMGNLGFGLKLQRLDKREQLARCEFMLQLIGLDKSFGSRKPSELSGGQQQRVALGRALVLNPQILFLDEPLANLDRRLRETMRTEILRICREMKMTTILVTHDQEEALSMGKHVAVMKDGQIEQWGTPEECYLSPKNEYVAEFLGEMNFFEVIVDGPKIQFLNSGFTLNAPVTSIKGKARLAIRPEFIHLRHEQNGYCLPAQIEQAIFLGTCYEVHLRCGPDIIKVMSNSSPKGLTAFLEFETERMRFFQ